MSLIKENVIKVGGEDAWRFAKLRFRELYDLADNTNMTEDKYIFEINDGNGRKIYAAGD